MALKTMTTKTVKMLRNPSPAGDRIISDVARPLPPNIAVLRFKVFDVPKPVKKSRVR